MAVRPDGLALEARRSTGARTPDRAADAAGNWAQALAIARTLAATGRLAPTDAYFVATLEQRLAAAPTAPGPPP